MILPDDEIPDRPLKRFYVGFSALGFVTFVGTLLYSDNFEEGLLGGVALGAAVGLIGGILAAFGKKWMRCVVTFALEIFLK